MKPFNHFRHIEWDRIKKFAQVVFGVLLLFLVVFFFLHERRELSSIKEDITNANGYWLWIGISTTLIYIFLQGLMYQYSFRVVKHRISLYEGVILFLKRNALSVFMPAGGVTSLGFFSSEIKSKNIGKTKIHFASIIYILCGFSTVFMLAIPALLYLVAQHQVNGNQIFSFFIVLCFIILLAFVAISFIRKGWAYRLLVNYIPEVEMLREELWATRFSLGSLFITIIISLFIEATGIIALFAAIHACNINAPLEVAVMGYVITLIALMISPILRGIGTVDVSLSILLMQYGLDKGVAVSVMLLFRLFEFWLPLAIGFISFFTNRNNILLRIMPALLALLLGVVNILSAITPAVKSRVEYLSNFLPVSTMHFSNYFVLISGIFLLLCSIYLLKGLRNAWILTVVLVSASLLAHLLKAIDYEEATFAAFILFVLIYTRRHYYLKSDLRFNVSAIWTLIISLSATLAFGVIGLYFMSRRHFGVEFDFKEASVAIIKSFFLLDTSELQPRTIFARYFLTTLYLLGGVSLSFTLYSFLIPKKFNATDSPEMHSKAKQLVDKYGNSSLDYFKTYFDKEIFFSEDEDAFIAYATHRNFIVTLETPVAAPDKVASVIIEFEQFCKTHGMKYFYYRVDEKELPLFTKKKYLLIGQEAIVHLDKFSLEGKDKKTLRNSCNRAQKENIKFTVYEPLQTKELLQKLKTVSNEWLSEEREETVFANGIFLDEEVTNQTVFTAEDSEGNVLAFINQIPSYVNGEATYDMLRKRPSTPSYVVDFMMIRMFEYFKSKGFAIANLGLSPMAGADSEKGIVHNMIRYAYDNMKRFRHYQGLRSFKEKFGPEWVSKYIVYNNTYDLISIPSILNDVDDVN